VDLDIPYAEGTLRNLYTMWRRPVHIETIEENKDRVLFSFGPDGNEREELGEIEGF
jgi:stage V sporulation protein R